MVSDLVDFLNNSADPGSLECEKHMEAFKVCKITQMYHCQKIAWIKVMKTKNLNVPTPPRVIIKLPHKRGIFLHHVDASHLHHHLSYCAGTAKTKQNKNVVNNWASIWVNCPKSWISTPAACSESRENEILIPLRPPPPNSTVATCWSPSSDMTALMGRGWGEWPLLQ